MHLCFLAIETTSSIDIMSSPDITTTHNITSEGSTTTEAAILKTTSAHVSTNTETYVESLTSYLRLLGIVDFKTRSLQNLK